MEGIDDIDVMVEGDEDEIEVIEVIDEILYCCMIV